jgi:hypothetical protein
VFRRPKKRMKGRFRRTYACLRQSLPHRAMLALCGLCPELKALGVNRASGRIMQCKDRSINGERRQGR